MKFSSSILAVLMISTFMSCGQNNSGSINSTTSSSNPSTSGSGTSGSQNSGGTTLSSSSSSAHTDLKKWFAASTESTKALSFIGSAGEFLVQNTQMQQGVNISASLSLCLGSIVNIGNCDPVFPTACYQKKSGKFYLGTPAISGNSVVGCEDQELYTKANNEELKSAIYGIEGLELQSVVKIPNTTRVSLKYVRSGYYYTAKEILIDTDLPSFVNPIQVIDNESLEVTYLNGIRVRVK